MFKFLRKRQNSHFNSKFKTLPKAPRTQAFTAFTKSTNQKSHNISSKHVISFTSKYILSIYISHFALRILSNIFINIWLSILSVKSFISLNKVVSEWVSDYDQIWVSSAFNKCPLTCCLLAENCAMSKLERTRNNLYATRSKSTLPKVQRISNDIIAC